MPRVNKHLGPLGSQSGRKAGDPEKDMRDRQHRSESARSASRDRVRAAKLKVEEFLREIKSQPCLDCGFSFPHPAMVFDHVRGEKLFPIANFKRHPTLAWQRLLDEIAKCDLVCANCHAEREWNKLHPDEPL